jgi:hypothetical protein
MNRNNFVKVSQPFLISPRNNSRRAKNWFFPVEVRYKDSPSSPPETNSQVLLIVRRCLTKKSNTLVCCKFLLNYPHNTLIAGYKYEEQIYHIIYYKMICCNLYWWLSNKKKDFGSCKRIEGRHGLASVASSSVEMVWLASILIRLAAGSWFSAAAELLQVLMLGLRWHWGQLCFARAIHPMKKSVTITNVYHGQKLD